MVDGRARSAPAAGDFGQGRSFVLYAVALTFSSEFPCCYLQHLRNAKAQGTPHLTVDSAGTSHLFQAATLPLTSIQKGLKSPSHVLTHWRPSRYQRLGRLRLAVMLFGSAYLNVNVDMAIE